MTASAIDYCTAVCLDGPLAGQQTYAINELGHRSQFALPPRPGGPAGIYELTRLATAGQPAEMWFLGFVTPSNTPTTTCLNQSENPDDR